MSASVIEKRPSSSSSSSSSTTVRREMESKRELDPLLSDLTEKRQSLRRNVVSMAAELKEVRCRLASQEQSFVKESITRQEAEIKAKKLEEEMNRLQKILEEKDAQLRSCSSSANKYLKELDNLGSQLSVTQASADASAASAELQCLAFLKELDEKNSSLKQHESRVNKLSDQLDYLQKDLQAREASQLNLKDEVLRIEHDIMQALAKAGSGKDCELRKALDEVSPRNFEKMNKLLIAKDEEIAKLRDEIKMITAHWKLKTKELESRLEKHQRVDQELKKRVLKLEFCLQEARAQTRKLQRMGERRDMAIKELKDELVNKQAGCANVEKQNIWDTSGFKIVASMSMLILVLFSKR